MSEEAMQKSGVKEAMDSLSAEINRLSVGTEDLIGRLPWVSLPEPAEKNDAVPEAEQRGPCSNLEHELHEMTNRIKYTYNQVTAAIKRLRL